MPRTTIPIEVIALQERLLRPMLDADHQGILYARNIRALIAVMNNRDAEERIRSELGCRPLAQVVGEDRTFERSRIERRVAAMEAVAAWQMDWPDAFHKGAKAAGLSQRHFARLRLSGDLLNEVRRLPSRHRAYRRIPKPLVHTAELQRLRRIDKARYRTGRAERLDGCGSP